MPATAAPRTTSPAGRAAKPRRDPRADDLSPAMRRAKELAGLPAAPARPPVARKHVAVPRNPHLAGRSRLTALPRSPEGEREVDFVALTAVRLRATAAEVAAGRAAGVAMRAKLAEARAAREAKRADLAALRAARSRPVAAPAILPLAA